MAGMTAVDVIRRLELRPLEPEGGHVAETWRDERSSAIYYLMARPECSALHRLDHLEIWAHHAGAAARMLLIHPDGSVTEPILGSDLEAGQAPQVVVPAGTWQAAEPLGDWTLVSTFMAPPYASDIVTFARRDDIVPAHPAHAERIARLCRF